MYMCIEPQSLMCVSISSDECSGKFCTCFVSQMTLAVCACACTAGASECTNCAAGSYSGAQGV